jgi:NAD(P)-dependent dehydrogenase (short-subunit alcohol dehydrogenase family)
MDLDLAGRSAFITGGSVGIGRAIAHCLAREGVNVCLAARNRSALESAAEEINAASAPGGGRATVIAVDTTDWKSVKQGIDVAAERSSRLDILVNCAAMPGGAVRNDIETADDEALLKDIDTKVVGYFRTVKAAVPHMRKARFGRILNIGGMTGRGTMAMSGLRNAALSHFTKTVSDAVGPHGITVNIIHPGVIETPHIHELYAERAKREGRTPGDIEAEYVERTPVRRVLQPEEVGSLVAFLSSPLAGGITGEAIGIDGGISRYISL